MTKDEITARLIEMGFQLEARFISQSNSRNRDNERRSLNYEVTVTRNNRQLRTDYSMGIGCAKRYSSQSDLNRNFKHEIETYLSELGRYPRKYDLRFPCTDKEYVRAFKGMSTLPASQWSIRPDLADVIWSLIMDSQAGQQTFNDFCADFGYNNDSISHKEVWETCVEIYETFRHVVGSYKDMEELEVLFQDY